MRANATVIPLLFSPSVLVLCGFAMVGCGRPALETPSAQVADVTVTRPPANNDNRIVASAEATAGTAVGDKQEATQSPPVGENPPDQVHHVPPTIATNSPTVPIESRLDRARRVVETEALIAKAIFEIAQGTPTTEEAKLLDDIAAKVQVYRLLGQDIDNDAENLAQHGLIMPWELRTRDVQRNLAMGRSPFRRRVSSASLALSRQIGNEQLESVRQVIDEARSSLLGSRMRRAWGTMKSEQQALCDQYQPEFAAEASGRNDAELARLTAEIQTAPVPAILNARAKLYATRGDLKPALDDLSQALSSHLENEDPIRLLRAQIEVELGNTKAAVRDYQIVAEKRGPLSDRAYVAWGELLEQSALADAMEKAEEALKINANCAAAHALLADVYKNMNQRQLTIESLQTAARLAPDDPIHFYRLGNLQAGLNAADEAVQAYTQAIAADSTWWKPYAGRATLHYHRHDLPAALRDLQDASEWAPREPSIYESRSVVLEALGRVDEANRDRAAAKTLAAGGIL